MTYQTNVFGNNVILYLDYLDKFINHSNMTWIINDKKDAYKIVKLIEWQINDKNIDVDIPSRKSIIDRIKKYYLKEQ